ERGRHAVIEEAGVHHAAVVVVVVLLVQRPADALDGAALDLPFDVRRVNRGADILHSRIAEDGDLAGVGVDFNIDDVRAVRAAGAAREQRSLAGGRATRAGGLGR